MLNKHIHFTSLTVKLKNLLHNPDDNGEIFCDCAAEAAREEGETVHNFCMRTACLHFF